MKLFKMLFVMLTIAACNGTRQNELPNTADLTEPKEESTSQYGAKTQESPGINQAFTYSYINSEINTVTPINTPEKKETFSELLAKSKPLTQWFKIRGDRDSVLLGKHGTAVAFAANTLVNTKNGSTPKQINVEITEYIMPSEFAAAGLVTETSDGRLLETVGMLNIVATEGVDTLQLKDNEDITVNFPMKPQGDNYQVWNGVQQDGLIKWELQDLYKEREKLQVVQEVPVHMHTLMSDLKNNPVFMRTCGGGTYSSYFNFRFAFPKGEGQELLDNKKMLAYHFKVNKKGVITGLSVPQSGYEKEVLDLSWKYRRIVEEFMNNYPKLDLCGLPYSRNQILRFHILPGNNHDRNQMASLSPAEGGYSVDELAELYKKTGEQSYLDAYLAREGQGNGGAVPLTKMRRSSKVMNSFLGVSGMAIGTILNVGTLGLINGDMCKSAGSAVRFVKGANIKAAVQGVGATLFMVFKKTRTFLQGSQETPGRFTFGDRIPKGEEVLLVAVSETPQGEKQMVRMNYTTGNDNISLRPEKAFDLQQFQNWLNKPDSD